MHTYINLKLWFYILFSKKSVCSIIAQSNILDLFIISVIYIVQKQQKVVHISVYSNQEKPV